MRDHRIRGFHRFAAVLTIFLVCGFVPHQVAAQEQTQTAIENGIDLQVDSLLSRMQNILLGKEPPRPGDTKDTPLSRALRLLATAISLYPHASQKVRDEFSIFPDRLKKLVVTEHAAGHTGRARDLKTFADFMRPYVNGLSASQSPSTAKVSADTKQTRAAAIPVIPAAQPDRRTAETAPPPPAAPPAATPQTTHAKVQTTHVRMSYELLRRGDQMLGLGQISAARMLYQRAAEMGLADAAEKMGKTYDAAFLRRHDLIGPQPDAQEAAEWYRKARQMRAQPDDTRLSAERHETERQP